MKTLVIGQLYYIELDHAWQNKATEVLFKVDSLTPTGYYKGIVVESNYFIPGEIIALDEYRVSICQEAHAYLAQQRFKQELADLLKSD